MRKNFYSVQTLKSSENCDKYSKSKKNQPRLSVNCQAIPEYDRFSFGFAKVLTFALFLSLSVVNIARADVCFLPDGKGCEQVPYEEYGEVPNPTYPKDCFSTKEEAMNARTAEVDSYYQNGDMWCIKPSCSGYNVTSMMPGGWSCLNCNDANSLNYNKYKCECDLKDVTPKIGYTIDLERCEEIPSVCPSYASTDCVPDECHECNSISSVNPVYSGGKECLIYSTVDEHCPEGYVSEEPADGCYSTQDMLCGEGTCYKETETPECGEGKRLAKANGVCSCECETGYHDDNGGCVLNQCSSGVAENTCDTANGYTFEPNNTSFENTDGDTVRCGSCVIDCPNYIEVPSTQIPYVVERSQSPGGQGNIDYDTGPLAINIATIGGYSCDYNIYATGKIAHHFEIKDVNGNLLTEITDLGSGIYPKQVNDLYLYTLPAGQTVNIMVRRKVSGHVIVGWSGKIYLSR